MIVFEYSETPPLGHLHSGDTKFGPLKKVHIIFIFVTSIEGTLLIQGKGHFFWVLKAGFNLHSGDTLAVKKWLTTKIYDKFKCSLDTNGDTFQNMN